MTKKVAKSNSPLPAKGSTYYYIRACMQRGEFIATETKWYGGMSDKFRLVKGNFYESLHEAQADAVYLNRGLEELRRYE